MSTNEYQAYKCKHNKSMQDINKRKRESREKDLNINTKIYFDVRATALRPRLHTKEFPLCPQRTFHIGTPHSGITTYTKEYTTPTLKHLYTRG